VILHVLRHYIPRNRVLTWDSDGALVLEHPDPGTVSEPGLIVYRFAVGLFYANAERLAEEVDGLVDVPDPPRWFVLAADAIDDVDFTGGKTLLELVGQLEARGIVFAIAGASPHLRKQLNRFGVTRLIGADRYYDTVKAVRAAFHKHKAR
jgi:MFS superfamily sulfate permease-like transporter